MEFTKLKNNGDYKSNEIRFINPTNSSFCPPRLLMLADFINARDTTTQTVLFRATLALQLLLIKTFLVI